MQYVPFRQWDLRDTLQAQDCGELSLEKTTQEEAQACGGCWT